MTTPRTANTATAQPQATTDQQKAVLIQQNAATYRALRERIDADYEQALDALQQMQQQGPVEVSAPGVTVDIVANGDLLVERHALPLTQQDLAELPLWVDLVRLTNELEPPLDRQTIAAMRAAVADYAELPSPKHGPTPRALLTQAAAQALLEFFEDKRGVLVGDTGAIRPVHELQIRMALWDGGPFDKLRNAIALLAASFDWLDQDQAHAEAWKRALWALQIVTPRGAHGQAAH